MNHVIFANPNNQKAKNLSADAMEQLAYQSESAVWRAYFLTGALELRNGVQVLPTPQPGSPDMIKALPFSNFLDFLAVRLNPKKSTGINLSIAMSIGTNKYTITIENSVLKYQIGLQSDADLSITMSKDIFDQLLLKQISLADLGDKDATVSNKEEFQKFMSLFDDFEFWFNIVTP